MTRALGLYLTHCMDFFDEPSQAGTMDWSLWANQTKYILRLQQCPLKTIELEELGDCHF